MIGVYQDNFGGDIEFQLGIKVKKYMWDMKLHKKVVGYKIPMFWILGFLVLFGHFQH